MKNSITLILILLLSLLLLNSCAFVRSVSLTQIPKERGEVVSASTEKFIFLLFNFNNDYVDSLERDLRAQCPGGEVRGILTKDEEISYFFAHTRKITATGYCIK